MLELIIIFFFINPGLLTIGFYSIYVQIIIHLFIGSTHSFLT